MANKANRTQVSIPAAAVKAATDKFRAMLAELPEAPKPKADKAALKLAKRAKRWAKREAARIARRKRNVLRSIVRPVRHTVLSPQKRFRLPAVAVGADAHQAQKEAPINTTTPQMVWKQAKADAAAKLPGFVFDRIKSKPLGTVKLIGDLCIVDPQTYAAFPEEAFRLASGGLTLPTYQLGKMTGRMKNDPKLPETELPLGWGLPVRQAGRALVIERVLGMGGQPRGNDVFDLYGHRVEVKEDGTVLHNGKKFNASCLVGHKDAKFDADATTTAFLFYGLIGFRILCGTFPAKAVRDTESEMGALLENSSLGWVDPARRAFEGKKLPIVPVTYGPWGIVLGKLPKGKAELYSVLRKERPTMGAHNQGNYFLDFEAVSIKVVKGWAIVPSTATAKWFKRLTLGLVEAARIPNPDTGYLLRNGAEMDGRLTKVAFLDGGFPFYLGALLAVKSAHVLGKKFAFYREHLFEDTWTGAYQPVLAKVGEKVKAGDTLASAGANRVLTDIAGEVFKAESRVVDGRTLVEAVVGDLDESAQLKLRSELLKGSVHHLDFLNVAWGDVLSKLGLTLGAHDRVCGDVALLGLQDGDDIDFVSTIDTNKATGSGNAIGQVSLMANTLQEKIAYDAEVHLNGGYDEKLKEFHAKAGRKVVFAVAVTPSIARTVMEAISQGIAHEGLTVHAVKLDDGRVLHVVLQRTTATVGVDLAKIESLPVPENLTTTFSPLEVALDANAKGMKKLARYLLQGGSEQRKEYVALQRAAWLSYQDGEFVYCSGNKLGKAVRTVDIARVAPGAAKRMLEVANDWTTLAGPLVLYSKSANGDVADMAMLHPTVLRAFGGGEQSSSLVSLTVQLLREVATGGENAARLLSQVRGALQTTAKSEGVGKRVFRGAPGVSARTRAGNVPDGWVAVSYYGEALKSLASLAGWQKSYTDSVGEKVSIHPFDVVCGMACAEYRSPQTTVTPVRVYCPDAPPEAIAAAKAMGDWPTDAEAEFVPQRYGVRTGNRLESHCFYISAVATAVDMGDHDGDSRVLVPVTDANATAEMLAFDWMAYRLKVLSVYMREVKDPLVYAFECETKKLKWAAPSRKTLEELQDLTFRSIENQTLHIGAAYNHAHAMLVMADVSCKESKALAASALMGGHYEEQLAGLDDAYYAFYQLLAAKGEMKPKEWAERMRDLNLGLDHTLVDWENFAEANVYVSAYQAFENDTKAYVTPGEERKGLLAGAVRRISQGKVTASLVKAIAQGLERGGVVVRDQIKKYAETSIACAALDIFFDEVYPELNIGAGTTEDEE